MTGLQPRHDTEMTGQRLHLELVPLWIKKECPMKIITTLIATICLSSTAFAIDEPDETASTPVVLNESRYEKNPDHDPNGIGKFYMGREIAHVMGFGPGGQGADWL